MTPIKITYFDYLTNKDVEVDLLSIIGSSDLFPLKGMQILKYTGCQKLAKFCNIVEKDVQFYVQPNKDNYQQHIWGVWLGYAIPQNSNHTDNKDKWVFADGEASMLNAGILDKDGKYKLNIAGKYKSNMAYKRAYCRALLKLLGLSILGIYSEVEAEEFKQIDDVTLDYSKL